MLPASLLINEGEVLSRGSGGAARVTIVLDFFSGCPDGYSNYNCARDCMRVSGGGRAAAER